MCMKKFDKCIFWWTWNAENKEIQPQPSEDLEIDFKDCGSWTCTYKKSWNGTKKEKLEIAFLPCRNPVHCKLALVRILVSVKNPQMHIFTLKLIFTKLKCVFEVGFYNRIFSCS